jgi:hypothetical protein
MEDFSHEILDFDPVGLYRKHRPDKTGQHDLKQIAAATGIDVGISRVLKQADEKDAGEKQQDEEFFSHRNFLAAALRAVDFHRGSQTVGHANNHRLARPFGPTAFFGLAREPPPFRLGKIVTELA